MATHSFRFAVGSPVHFGGRSPFFEVVWRGVLVLGPVGGRYRVAVYWLGGDTWDCYYEDQLWSIGQHPF